MNESRKQKYFSTVATRSEKLVGLQKLCCSGFDLVVQMIGFIFGRRSEKSVCLFRRTLRLLSLFTAGCSNFE